MSRRYCAYCGRVAHRCGCAATDSRVQQLLDRQAVPSPFAPRWMAQPFKRGVPPQIKRRERNTLRRHYTEWYDGLVAQYDATCANCGATEQLVVDHVLPIAKGGLSAYDNLQLLCAECNRIKGKLWFDCRPA